MRLLCLAAARGPLPLLRALLCRAAAALLCLGATDGTLPPMRSGEFPTRNVFAGWSVRCYQECKLDDTIPNSVLVDDTTDPKTLYYCADLCEKQNSEYTADFEKLFWRLHGKGYDGVTTDASRKKKGVKSNVNTQMIHKEDKFFVETLPQPERDVDGAAYYELNGDERTATYCEYLAAIGDPCDDECNWLDRYVPVSRRARGFAACATGSCDTLSDYRKGDRIGKMHLSKCTTNTRYTSISPVLHRPSGLSVPDACECHAKPGEGSAGRGCKLQDNDATVPWCYLKPESALCLEAYDTKKKNRDKNARAINDGSDCVGPTKSQDSVRLSWTLGSAAYQQSLAERTVGVTYNTFYSEMVGFEDSAAKRAKPLHPQRLSISYTVPTAFTHQHRDCTASFDSSQLVNVFSVQVPECYESPDGVFSGCMRYSHWREDVLKQMDGDEDENSLLVSETYVRFELPRNMHVVLYADAFCEGASAGKHATVDDTTTGAPDHYVDVVQPDGGATLHGYSWHIRPNDAATSTLKCLSYRTPNPCGYGQDGTRNVPEDILAVPANNGNRFECVERPESHQIVMDSTCDGNIDFQRWSECPAHHRSADPAPDKACTRCPTHTPSRPSTEATCVSCGPDKWFKDLEDGCVFIVRLQWHQGWKKRAADGSLGDVGEGDAFRLFTQYHTPADQTRLLDVLAGQFLDADGELAECDSDEDNEDYKYRDACGTPGRDPTRSVRDYFDADASNFVYVSHAYSDEVVESSWQAISTSTVYHVQWAGVLRNCLACGVGLYNAKCYSEHSKLQRAEDASVCAPCNQACGSGSQYLHHAYRHDGCAEPKAVTNTECRPCRYVKAASAGTVYDLVVGCGSEPMARWDARDHTVLPLGPNPVCDYATDSPQCRDEDERGFRQSNDFKGNAARHDVQDIPYCPRGHYIDDSRDGCGAEWRTQWSPGCCAPCRSCLPTQKKKADWEECSGSTTTDTEQGQCTDKCSTGYYLYGSREGDANVPGLPGTCVRCRSSCQQKTELNIAMLRLDRAARLAVLETRALVAFDAYTAASVVFDNIDERLTAARDAGALIAEYLPLDTALKAAEYAREVARANSDIAAKEHTLALSEPELTVAVVLARVGDYERDEWVDSSLHTVRILADRHGSVDTDWQFVRFLPFGSPAWHSQTDRLAGTAPASGTFGDKASPFNAVFGGADDSYYFISDQGMTNWIYFSRSGGADDVRVLSSSNDAFVQTVPGRARDVPAPDTALHYTNSPIRLENRGGGLLYAEDGFTGTHADGHGLWKYTPHLGSMVFWRKQ